MSERSPAPQPDSSAFREALAQWQLAARTEVKRCSSLPSSMFDACDPMLETRLAESVEAMLARLHEPGRTEPPASEGDLDQRTETVLADELRALPRRLGAPPTVSANGADADLDEGMATEYLSILVDLCEHGSSRARIDAASLLRRDFGVGEATTLAADLMACFTTRGDAAAPPAAAVEAVCARIAAAVAAGIAESAPNADDPPGGAP